jgi:hypothetical protein
LGGFDRLSSVSKSQPLNAGPERKDKIINRNKLRITPVDIVTELFAEISDITAKTRKIVATVMFLGAGAGLKENKSEVIYGVQFNRSWI